MYQLFHDSFEKGFNVFFNIILFKEFDSNFTNNMQ